MTERTDKKDGETDIRELLKNAPKMILEQSQKDSEKNLRELLKRSHNRMLKQDMLEAKREIKRAKSSLIKAQDYYTKMSAAKEHYESDLLPLMDVFDKLMPSLACFAGCQSEEDYNPLCATLENALSRIRRCLSRFPETPDFRLPPLVEDDEPLLPERGDYRRYADDKLSADIESCLDLEPKYTEYMERTKKKFDEADEYWKQAQNYSLSARKICDYLLDRAKHWDYALLLKRSYPLLLTLQSADTDEWTPKDYTSFACQVEQLLSPTDSEPFRLLNFYWIMPDSPECQSSQDIQIDFRAAEASWPGLYCELKKEPGRLICVIPGGAARK